MCATRVSSQLYAFCVTCLIHMRDATHSCVCHDSCIYARFRLRGIYSVWRDSFIRVWRDSLMCATTMTSRRYAFCVTRLNRMCDMAHLYVWHDSFICVTWLIHMCDYDLALAAHMLWDICVTWLIHPHIWHDAHILWDMTVSRHLVLCRTHPVTHDSFIRVTCLIHVWHDSCVYVCDYYFVSTVRILWGVTHSYMWHDSSIRVTWLIHTCDMTHTYVWYDLRQWVAPHRMTWLIRGTRFMRYTSYEYTSYECTRHILWVHMVPGMRRDWLY